MPNVEPKRRNRHGKPKLAHATSALVACCALLTSLCASASEVYLQLGLPGVGLGYVHSISPSLAIRGDLSSLGTHTGTKSENGLHYNAKLKTERSGLFADWFAGQGGFRITGGLTLNNYKLDLAAIGTNSTSFQTRVGNNSYRLGTDDGLDVTVKFPGATPYLGIGWGHHAAQGWRFCVDLGASIGKAKVSAVGRGALATAVGQQDVELEVAKVRQGVGDIRYLPQVSFAVGYSF